MNLRPFGSKNIKRRTGTYIVIRHCEGASSDKSGAENFVSKFNSKIT